MISTAALRGAVAGMLAGWSIAGHAGVGLTSSGIAFPDGTVQTTAAGPGGKCDGIGQLDVPVTLDTPGVYCLTEDVSSLSAAITITADNVTVDLNGFHIDGSANGSRTESYGIRCESAANAVVTGGAVTGYYGGVHALGCYGLTIKDMALYGLYYYGIFMLGSDGATVTANNIYDIGGSTLTTFVYDAIGISVSASVGLTISDNAVHDVWTDGGGAIQGVRIVTDSVVVSDNRLYRLRHGDGGSALPIFYAADDSVGEGGLFMRNRFVGSSTGSAIVINGDSTAVCADNVATGFASAVFQCTDAGGNFP